MMTVYELHDNPSFMLNTCTSTLYILIKTFFPFCTFADISLSFKLHMGETSNFQMFNLRVDALENVCDAIYRKFISVRFFERWLNLVKLTTC